MTIADDALLIALGNAIDRHARTAPSLYTRVSQVRSRSLDLPPTQRTPTKLRRLVEAGLVSEDWQGGNKEGAYHLVWGLTTQGWTTYESDVATPRCSQRYPPME